jgi:hypothetical protein
MEGCYCPGIRQVALQEHSFLMGWDAPPLIGLWSVGW